MGSTLALLIAIALLDTTSMVPLALVPLAAMLGGARPYARALGFIAGIGLTYYLAGALVLLGLSRLFDTLDAYFERVWFEPNRLELVLQIVIGVVLLVLAWKLVRARAAGRPSNGRERGGVAGAFVAGVAITLVGLPGGVPYVGALDQILRADVGLGSAALMLLVYNLVFAAPLVLLVGIAALFPAQSGPLLEVVGRVMARWGTRVLVVVLSLLGAVMVIDGIGWFFGRPLIPVGTPPPGL